MPGTEWEQLEKEEWLKAMQENEELDKKLELRNQELLRELEETQKKMNDSLKNYELVEDEDIYIQTESRQDSIEVSRNAKGEYSWKVKIYFDSTEEEAIDTIDRLNTLTKYVRTQYGN